MGLDSIDFGYEWGEVLKHPTERHRPREDKWGLDPEEIGYNHYLQMGKVVFLKKISNKLKEDYPKMSIGVRSYGNGEEMLGYVAQIPSRHWWGGQKIMGTGLASIGAHDRDLGINANHKKVIEVIGELASTFEKEILSLETKPSGLEPFKVYISNFNPRCLASEEEAEEFFKRYS